ncbi:unnamed protein product [Adineta ricciae]|uniref:Uncharacterized protein n=1 Tax=Adineta ricciae TaxID=249248 RepID=A0A815R3K4_ADIRI|nr:unnamed protein product [Adineta ricciae]CAF1471974.1 unnamed protein product [Adineta ricciae]
MKVEISFLAILFFGCTLIDVQSKQVNDDCMVDPGFIDECVQWINATCENATFVTDRLAYMDTCPMYTIFWNAPYYNLTILFDSHLLKPYELCVTPVRCTKAFRTNEEDQEISVDWDLTSLEPVCFGTKRMDRPTMKFRFDAQHQTRCRRTFINFHYIV